ncbi:MAG: 23S rRNA (pseudouridine(1915)-N(3))-methyltransferase RlmH [Desulfovibrionales bacterium]
MKSIRIISVGKLKKKYWSMAADHYAASLSRFYRLERTAVKDAPAHVSIEQRMQTESDAVRTRLTPQDLTIGLDLEGRTFSSTGFSRALSGWIEDPQKIPCFLVGGAYGFSPQFKSSCDLLFSLGPLTFPHEMAQVVLLEQLYRAAAILHNLPYHH